MRLFAVAAIALILVAVACAPVGSNGTASGAPTSTPTPAPATDQPAPPGASATDPATPATEPTLDTEPTPGAEPTPAPPDPAAPVWRTAVLRDVVSGAEFRIDELRGQVVAIEPMAIWCVNCRLQQREARAALASFDSSNVFYLSLDVDPREREPDLADYSAAQEFPWHFAVASPDVARSLADEFGDQILSPPSTPLIVIGPDGNVVHQGFGPMAAADLAQLLQQSAS
jgi:hypothetical protein